MIYAENRKAGFEYTIKRVLTAGMVLNGKQAAIIRKKQVTIPASYVVWQKGRLELINVGFGGEEATVPLLLDQKEVDTVRGFITVKGQTAVALKVKTVKRWIKVEIGLAKGKTLYDKRQTIKKRDLDREERRNTL